MIGYHLEEVPTTQLYTLVNIEIAIDIADHLKEISSYPLVGCHPVLPALFAWVKYSPINQPVQHCRLPVTEYKYKYSWLAQETNSSEHNSQI